MSGALATYRPNTVNPQDFSHTSSARSTPGAPCTSCHSTMSQTRTGSSPRRSSTLDSSFSVHPPRSCVAGNDQIC